MNVLCIPGPERRTPAAHQTAVAVGAMADTVRRALAEDRAEDDITTRWAVPEGTRAHARVVTRQDGVVAGTAIPAEVYRQLGNDVVVTEHVQDGDRVHTGQELLTLDTVRAVAEPGVDAISVGAITHSAPAFDLSLLLTPMAPAGGAHPARFG